MGADGKQYPPSSPNPPKRSKPKRDPLPDQARTAVWELGKVLERLERLSDDDRFKRDRAKVAKSAGPMMKAHMVSGLPRLFGQLVDADDFVTETIQTMLEGLAWVTSFDELNIYGDRLSAWDVQQFRAKWNALATDVDAWLEKLEAEKLDAG
jgi:hypothetical protein